VVGFTLISYEKECDYDDTSMYEVYRLMIAKEYQGHDDDGAVVARLSL